MAIFSPQGRFIREVDGEPGPIIQRGNDITSFADDMSASAMFLKRLADDTAGQKGAAAEKLQEIVGDTHVELEQVARMYGATGPILTRYGHALADLQPSINCTVDECRDRWEAYFNAPGYLAGDRPSWDKADSEDAAEVSAQQAQDQRRQQLWEDFQASGKKYDDYVDDWQAAFDAAADDIGDVLSDGIQDSFWDNVDGFVASMLVVLKWAGIVVGVLAILIGGPILALIGSIIAIATLVLTTYQFIRGDAGWTDMVLAIIGVIPFGSIGKLANGRSGAVEFAGDGFKAFKPSSWSNAAQEGRFLRDAFHAGGGGWKGGGRAAWDLFKHNNPTGPGDVMTRFLFGKDTNKFTELTEKMLTDGSKFSASWEFGFSLFSGPWKSIDKIATWTGNSDQKPSTLFPWVGAIFK
ncbi:hypothetical protein [Microbacterium sp. YY-01]|uniref:hypothetical protein n=1 Tax=Microbacterium sp. YY-01 TaxID=3421634 RepID=UPI003D17158F